MSEMAFKALSEWIAVPETEMRLRARDFYEEVSRRRTVRDFSDRPIPREIIEDCLRAAGTAPNGANMQPWHFVVVSDPSIKQRIRVEAEKEERAFGGLPIDSDVIALQSEIPSDEARGPKSGHSKRGPSNDV